MMLHYGHFCRLFVFMSSVSVILFSSRLITITARLKDDLLGAKGIDVRAGIVNYFINNVK